MSPPFAFAPPPGARIAVLGGAGGIGRALVEAGLGLGLRLAVLDLPRTLEAHPPPAGVTAIAIDVADESAVADAFAGLGALDGFVALAGFMTRRTAIAEMASAEFDALLGGNLRGTFLAARAAIEKLRAGSAPAMVLVSSGLALRAMPGYGAYAAAKAGMISLAKTIAVENAPWLRCNCVAPGAVDTEFLTGGTGQPAERRAAKQLDEAAYLRGVPLGRIAVATDMVGPILFLLGPGSGYMTGQTLYVNGGGLTP